MLFSPFDQLVGAAGDVKELEYISALHQTDETKLRPNASIRAEDIRLYLKSRHGVSIPADQVQERIVAGLGGGSNQNETLDLMEIAALLLIPTLIKASDGIKQDQPISATTPPSSRRILGTVSAEDRPPTPTSRKRLNTADLDGISEEAPDDEGGTEVEKDPLEEEKDQLEEEDEIPVTPKLIETVLNAILHDVTGDGEPKELTTTLIEQIFVSYGELGLASDEELLQEMVDVVQTKQQQSAPLLTASSFARALTSDVRVYDVQNETKPITNFEAARGKDSSQTHITTTPISRQSVVVEENQEEQTFGLMKEGRIHQAHTLSSIDITAATYKNRNLTIALWTTILVTYFAYFGEIQRSINDDCATLYNYTYTQHHPWRENKEGFRCELFAGIFTWSFMFFAMSFFGTVSVFLGNIGNSAKSQTWWKPLIGCICVLLMVTLPFLYLKEGMNVEHKFLHKLSMILGVFTCGMHLNNLLVVVLSPATMKYVQKRSPRAYRMLTGPAATDMNLRRAASRKMARMTQHALDLIHTDEALRSSKSTYGQAFQNFSDAGVRYVRNGGFWWSWRGSFCEKCNLLEEGIWTPERMIASNVAQYVVLFYILAASMMLLATVNENYGVDMVSESLLEELQRSVEAQIGDAGDGVRHLVGNISSLFDQILPMTTYTGMESVCSNMSSAKEIMQSYCTTDQSGHITCAPDAPVNYLCPFLSNSTRDQDMDPESAQAFLAGAGFNVTALMESAYDRSQEVVESGVSVLYPVERYMVMVPLSIGSLVALFLATGLAVTYIPSVNTTILKLRCGYIPSLQSGNFGRYRRAPEDVTYMTASTFWGALASSIVFGGLVGAILFFYLWNATAYFAMRLSSFVVGISVITAFRLGLEKVLFLCSGYKAFYRERPAFANLAVLTLEWANFAVSAGFIFVRLLKFLVAASLYTGRLDTPFLADEISRIGTYEIDLYPKSHLQAILLQEAHRHPYIESLGLVYLMKLRFGTNFGNRAGSCWRLIFVYALMPWLHRYRYSTRQDELIDDSMTSIPVGRLSISFGELDDSSFGTSTVSLHTRNSWRAIRSKEDHTRRRRSSISVGSQLTGFSLHSTNRSMLNMNEVLRLREVTQLRRPISRNTSRNSSQSSFYRLREPIDAASFESSLAGSTSIPTVTEADRNAARRIAELELEVELLKEAMERNRKKSSQASPFSYTPRQVDGSGHSNGVSV